MSEISLESALSGETETTESATETTETEVSRETGTEQEPGKEAEQSTEQEPGSADKETEDKEQQEKEEKGTLAGLKAERVKRQAAEAARDELSTRITQLEGRVPAKQVEPVKVPDPIEDPQGFVTHIRNENEAANLKSVLKVTRAAMKRQESDFDETMVKFGELANADKTILTKMLGADDPYHFAYTYAKKHLEFQDVENVQEWKDKTRAELRVEIEAENAEKAGKTAETEELNDEGTAIPSLAGKTSVGGGITTALIDLALEDVVGGSYNAPK